MSAGTSPGAHGAPVAGVVLAGGASRRMGVAKAGLVHAGRTFLARVVGTLRAGGAGDVVVVAGSAHDAVRAALPAGDPARVLRNPAPERGQLSSLKVALAHLAAPGAGTPPLGVVVALVDHPTVSAATVARLIAALRGPDAPAIVLPTHAGRRGHPVAFAARVWPELLACPDEQGARAVVHADPARVVEVAVDDPGILVDVDTPDDFRRLTAGPPGAR